MNPRKLVLLNPYQLPTQSPLTLGNEDVACWLNGYSALWHPAALWGAAAPPSVEVTYDHEQPQPGHVYAVPEAPPLFLPDEWEQKVREAGAVCFKATTDRQKTLANLRAALAPAAGEGQERPAEAALLDTPPDQVAPFLAVGLGYVISATLCGAMEHENLLETDGFWQDVQQGVAALGDLPFTRTETPQGTVPRDGYSPPPRYDDYGNYDRHGDFADAAPSAEDSSPPQDFEQPPEQPAADSSPEEGAPPEEPAAPVEEWYHCLQSAAGRLLSAREVLYPVPIYLIDICLPDAEKLDRPWPDSFAQGVPLNIVASSALLEQLAREQPERLAELRERVAAEQAEVCGGSYVEREDALLPVESQLWNLLKGQAVARELLGNEVRVFARRRFGAHPQLPLLLNNAGLNRALFVTFDEAAVPTYQAPVINWPSPDGKQVDCFTRTPFPAADPQTWFNLGHHLFKTIREDHYATIALLHRGEPAVPWYDDWLELSRLAPVLGQWVTFSQFFGQVQAGEYASALSPDEFHSDYLSERTGAAFEDRGAATQDGGAKAPDAVPVTVRHGPAKQVPVSGFARHARMRRRIDTCWTLAALQRGLAGRNDPLRVEDALRELEAQVELKALDLHGEGEFAGRLTEVEKQITGALADRLLSRATAQQPGYLILNPCSFTRRVALELDGGANPLPIADPVKACQLDGDKLRAVVEVPPLGFAWIPREGPKGTPPAVSRIRLADDRHVRNEFLEAELDPQTGGLRALRDRSGMNRLAQRLVFNPGSAMRATAVKVTSAGPALGEIVAEGTLLGEQEQVLARFRQRYRVWLGRPMLDVRVEIFPEQRPAGYPWHAYYGARFAWRDERAVLLRGVNGTGYITNHVRPQTPDYLEVRLARQSTVLFPGGLPFHQRQEGRYLDMILVPEGETAEAFEFGVALDREHPMQTALGMITPVPVVATTKGPPHIGAKGWLFHLDAPNLLLTGLRPGKMEVAAEGAEASANGIDAITARLLECGTFQSHAELRCVRDPRRVALLDARGTYLMEGSASGDAALFDVAPGDLVQLQVEFSQ
jgi:hypothetical protein